MGTDAIGIGVPKTGVRETSPLRVLLIVFVGLRALAGAPDHVEHLPPALPWDGKSRELALPADHEWATPCERSGLTATPRYRETVAWLERLAAASSDLEMVSIGRSAEGRDLWMVVAARGVDKNPAALLASGKPVVFAHAGIHSGEIDGKDAGMMLLRDMTVLGTRARLLDRVHFLFVPILNVDGHERFSHHNRINQRGPVEMGWRTNSRNLNLNRDFTKLETEEVRAVVDVINAWSPDLYLDLHVTDGSDYQYDVTWDTLPDYAWSPNASRWIHGGFAEAVNRRLEAMGHVPGSFVWPANGRDYSDGLVGWVGTPRFSNVYGVVRHLPTILVENHSLKPYDQRVLGTYVFLEAALEFVGREHASLRAAVAKDRALRPRQLALTYETGPDAKKETVGLKGVSSEIVESPVTGGEVVRWTGETVELEVTAHHQNVPGVVVARPEAYYIPAGWSHIADKLRLHGIEVERLDEPTTVEVRMYRLPDASLAGGGSSWDQRAAIYEGRVRIDPGEPVVEEHRLELPAGSFRVPTDQPLGDLAMMLLEPQAPDSLFQWGFFLEILTRAEYAEAYVLEPMARAMLAEDAALAAEFRRRLETDPEFAADPAARLQWFYRRTPYFDTRLRLYPVARQ